MNLEGRCCLVSGEHLEESMGSRNVWTRRRPKESRRCRESYTKSTVYCSFVQRAWTILNTLFTSTSDIQCPCIIMNVLFSDKNKKFFRLVQTKWSRAVEYSCNCENEMLQRHWHALRNAWKRHSSSHCVRCGDPGANKEGLKISLLISRTFLTCHSSLTYTGAALFAGDRIPGL